MSAGRSRDRRTAPAAMDVIRHQIAGRAADASPPVMPALRTPGRPLDAATRRGMEARLGHDFSRVRVHTDPTAAFSARLMGAAAYTVGRHVVFGPGRFAPTTRDGAALLAHELGHVVQQGDRDAADGQAPPLERPDAAAEREADAAAESGRAIERHLPLAVQRRTAIERSATIGRERGPVWDVIVTVSGAPDVETPAYRDFLWVCSTGINEAAKTLAGGAGVSTRTIRVSMAYHEPFDEAAVEAEAYRKALESVMGALPAPVLPPAPPPRQHVEFEEPAVIVATVPRTGPRPVEATTGLTRRHRELQQRPRIAIPGWALTPGGTVDWRRLGEGALEGEPPRAEEFGVGQTLTMITERQRSAKGVSVSLGQYKDYWVRVHRHIIQEAAREANLPAWVLAGVAWTETGGEPALTDSLSYWGRSAGLKGGQPERASFGAVAIQIRRAAEELGYDPAALTSEQTRAIIASLEDPQQNLFVVASHLDRLRNLDAPGKTADMLTDDDIIAIGARYNGGPELPLEELYRTRPKAKDYGVKLVAKRQRVERLLED